MISRIRWQRKEDSSGLVHHARKDKLLIRTVPNLIPMDVDQENKHSISNYSVTSTLSSLLAATVMISAFPSAEPQISNLHSEDATLHSSVVCTQNATSTINQSHGIYATI